MFKNVLLYSIKDCVTGCFSDIKLFVNQAQAERWFDNFCSESKIASDLQLFILGNFDVESGEIIADLHFIKNGGAVNA